MALRAERAHSQYYRPRTVLPGEDRDTASSPRSRSVVGPEASGWARVSRCSRPTPSAAERLTSKRPRLCRGILTSTKQQPAEYRGVLDVIVDLSAWFPGQPVT